MNVLKDYMEKLDSSLDGFSDAVMTLITVIAECEEKNLYRNHLMIWLEHCKDLKARARYAMDTLEASGGLPNIPENVVTPTTTD